MSGCILGSGKLLSLKNTPSLFYFFPISSSPPSLSFFFVFFPTLYLGVANLQIATAYVPLLIQMYATAVFHFTQGDNGFLMSGWAYMRALFLLFLFPRIIAAGRRSYAKRHPATVPAAGQRAG